MKANVHQRPSEGHSHQGIALVITLLMLAVVTITAVAFLAVSRRERASVSSASEQARARMVAEIALQHAEGKIVSRIAALTNRVAYGGYFVSTNFFNPYFTLAGNFSYLDFPDYRRLTNVGFYKDTNNTRFDLSKVSDRELYARVLGNLYYDPRPPVFISTNRDPEKPLDFRYYLDLNRNGQFETNGLIGEQDKNARPVLVNGKQQRRFYWGDPEYIGVLESPDVPHSGTNKFIGRFAYVVVPTSQTLDLNYFGNNAKRFEEGKGLPPVTTNPNDLQSGYLRNQGVGPWELNSAAFFSALNTNIWGYSSSDYRYSTNILNASTGLAFSDSERLRRRVHGTWVPDNANLYFSGESGSSVTSITQTSIEKNYIDDYSDGPLQVTLSDIRARFDNDDTSKPWSGSHTTNRFSEINELFDSKLGMASRVTGQYTNNGTAYTSPNSSYDRYTFYKLLNQLGTDSSDGRFESGVHPAYSDAYLGLASVNPYGFYRRAKLNLNYAQNNPDGDSEESARVSTFRPWKSLEWFTNATHRLLLSEFTNGLPFFPPRLQQSVPGLAIHGYVRVQETNGAGRLVRDYITNYVYDAQVHRNMQLAANLYDATTNNFLGPVNQAVVAPSVFRPLVYEDSRSPGVIRIHSYEEVTNGNPAVLLSRNWVSPDLVTNNAPKIIGAPQNTLSPSLPETVPPVTSKERGFHLFGLPWVVGAKKGLPNFNQALWQTVFQPTRRLIITRPSRNLKIGQNELPFAGANNSGFRTEYQYLINVTNLIGVESWNSYLTNYPRSVRIFTTNVLEFTLQDETIPGDPKIILQRRELLSTNYVKAAGWPAKEYESRGWIRNLNSPYFQFPSNITNRATEIPGGLAIGTSFIYDPVQRQAFPQTMTNQGRVVISQANQKYLNPILSAYVTNSLLYAIVDEQTGRILDIATLRSSMVRTNLISTLGLDSDGVEQRFFNEMAGSSGNSGAQLPSFWSTNLVQNNRTRGIDNQFLASIGTIRPSPNLWRNPVGSPVSLDQQQFTIDGLKYFLYGILPVNDPGYAARIRSEYGSNLVAQVGFNPSPRVYLSDRRMANDPLVHYTKDDLAPGYFFMTEAGYTEVFHEFFGLVQQAGIKLATNVIAFDVGRSRKFVNAYAPWGTNANLTGVPSPSTGASSAFDYGFKDPLIWNSDSWHFPISTNAFYRFANVGQIGRVHRGTPWQTIYFKSKVASEVPANSPSIITRLLGGRITWAGWSGNRQTHPTNDWKLADLFTTAVSDTSGRGQLGVNQPGSAAWAALLSEVPLLSNKADKLDPLFLSPNSVELGQVIGGYVTSAGQSVPGIVQCMTATNSGGSFINPNGVFPKLGSILQVPTLSDRAPFLSSLDWTTARNTSDEVLERIPQQILSLLKADEPRFVVYAFGQTLQPAPNAVILRPGPLYGMTTNYVITGEYVTKTVFRLDGDPRRLTPVVEDHRVITATQ